MYFFADKEIFCLRSSEGEYVRFLFFCNVESILFFQLRKKKDLQKTELDRAKDRAKKEYVTISLNFKEQDVMM